MEKIVVADGVFKRHIVHICTRCNKVMPSTDSHHPYCVDCLVLFREEEQETEDYRGMVNDMRYGTY